MQKKQSKTLSNAKISAANVALDRLAALTNDTVLRFRIIQNAGVLAPVADAYSQTSRKIIIDNKATIQDDGKVKFESTEDEAKARIELRALDELETEVDYYPFALSRLATVPDVDYSILVPLQWMIIDDVEE